MPLTGQLGTIYSQPGAVQPGYFCTGNAAWLGDWPLPGFIEQMREAGLIVERPPYPGQYTVTPAVASQIAASDPYWWGLH